MSMTREEAIAILQEKYDYCKSFYDLAARPKEDYAETAQYLQALQVALTALRGPTRERVEKVWRGEWIIGEPDVLGVPIHCSRCGWGSDHADQRAWIEYKGHIFCGHCGAPMTDKAVEMVMERMEALYERNDD